MADRYASLKQGLVGAWIPSISGSGLLLPDLSGRGNNGSLTNMDASDWVSSQYGRALDFDGVNDTVDTNQSGLFNFTSTTSQFTITLFGLDRSGNRYSNAIAKNSGGSSADGGYYLSLSQDSTGLDGAKGHFTVYMGINVFTGVDFNFPQNEWRHVAIVVNMALSGTARVEAYINGVNTGTKFSQGVGTAITTNTRTVRIGSDSAGNFVHDGQFDDIRIYNRALTESEIRLLASEPGIGFKPAKKLSRFSTRYTYKPPKAKVFEGVRVRDHDYASLRHGLVGAWCPSLPNGGSGNTLPDQSGRGNHGTLTNMGPEDWVSSGDGRALDFDGVNDFIPIGSSGSMVRSGAFSVSAWCRRSGGTGTQYICADYNASGTVCSFLLLARTGTGTFEFGWENPQNTYNGAISTTTITNNVWYHVATTWDGATRRIYVNGIEEGANSTAQSQPSAGSVGTMAIGRPGSFNGLYWTGQIDDCRLFSRALTESEIRLLASRRGIGLQPSPTRFIAREKKTGLRRKILTGQT